VIAAEAAPTILLKNCGSGRTAGAEELRERKNCGSGRTAGAEELWERKNCGSGRTVGAALAAITGRN